MLVMTAIEKKACDAFLLNINDDTKMGITCSYGSGKAEDTAIASLAFDNSLGQNNLGVPCSSDSHATNQVLMNITEELNDVHVHVCAGLRQRVPVHVLPLKVGGFS